MGHTAINWHVKVWNRREFVGVVRVSSDRFTQIQTHFGIHDIECSRKLDVVHMVAPQVDMHQAGNAVVFLRVAVEMHTLDQRRGAVPNANNGDTNFFITHE